MVIKKKSLSERKVLKVNNGSQDTSMNMPPMDMQPEMGNDMGGDFMQQGQDMGQGMPMDDQMGEVPNQFDTNFDAGVEADEEQDPKKYIQQLTGKLSQTLQKYTDNNGQPDVDLNKYVAGMITKQAMKGLSEEDAEEIIDKVKADEDFSLEDGGDENLQQDVPQDSTSLLSGSEEGFINALFMACLKDENSAVGIRSLTATGANMDVAESLMEELKHFKLSNKYEEIFVKNTEEGVNRTYLRRIGGMYELVLLSTVDIGFTQVYGINSTIIHQLIK